MKIFSILQRSWIVSILIAASVGIILFKFTGAFKKDRAVDYITAVTSFSKWKKEGKTADLAKLKEMMTRQPELKTKFEASIGQYLLISGQKEEAASFIREVLKRSQKSLALYRQFAEISLMLSRNEITEALEESKSLQKLLKNQKELELLEAYNLLRLAMLEQEIGSSNEELQRWNELSRHPAFFLIDQSIYRDALSLADYMKYRESLLMREINRSL